MIINQERFLITGAAGFVGACLTHELVRLGVRPHVLLMNATDAWRLASIRDRIIIHDADITDAIALKRIVQQVQPTVIYHLAAHGAYPTQTDAAKILQTNVMGTWNLLDALKDIQYKLLVNTGSSSEYGYKELPMKETDVVEPNSIYAIAKSSQTELCGYMAREHHQPIVTFRLFSIYGPWEEPTRLVPTTIRRVLNQQPVLMADPLTARDFVFVDDTVKAYLAIDRLVNYPGEVFNIASGKQQTLSNFIDALAIASSKKLDVQWGAYPSRSWDTACWVGDASKAAQLLDWQATTSLEQGLSKTLDWMIKHGQ